MRMSVTVVRSNTFLLNEIAVKSGNSCIVSIFGQRSGGRTSPLLIEIDPEKSWSLRF